MRLRYRFKAELWKHQGTSSWYFVTLPIKLSSEIRKVHQKEEEGWGRLKTIARIAGSEWSTAIWFDTKRNAYLLPVKAEIRKKQLLNIGQMIAVEIDL